MFHWVGVTAKRQLETLLCVCVCVHHVFVYIYCVFVLFQNTVANYALQDVQESLAFVIVGIYVDLNRISSMNS